MSIPPITPPVGPPSTPSGPGPSGPTPLVSGTPDNQSSYSNDIASGKQMNIVEFSSVILAATKEAEKTSWKVQQYNASSRKDLYNAVVQASLDRATTISTLVVVSAQYSEAYNQTDTSILNLNPQITSYNSGNTSEQNQINAVNAAIDSYNAGTISQAQLQVAINSYNGYVASRNVTINQTNTSINTFNSSVATTNESVYEVNQRLAALGIDPLPAQDPYGTILAPLSPLPDAPASPPAQRVNFTPQNLSLAVNTMDVRGKGEGTQLFRELFQPLADLFAHSSQTAAILQAQSAYQAYVQFFLQGDVPYLPPAFYTLSPRLFGASGAGPGSGVALAGLIISAGNPLTEGIIANSIFQKNAAVFSRPQTPQVVNSIKYLSLQLLSHIGLLAGSPALRLLEGRLPFIDLRSSPVAMALGSAITSEIGSAVSQGILSKGVKGILSNAFPDISAENLNALALQLTTSSELFMLQVGLFQLAQVLNFPQLSGKVLSTLDSAQTLGISNNPLSPSDILPNVGFRDSISKNIAAQFDLSLSETRQILNLSINAAVVNGELNQQSLINNFIQNGLDSQQALNAANITQSYLQAEILSQGTLDSQVKSGLLAKSILTNELVNQILTAQPDINARELRDQLATNFISNGATLQEALTTATLAVTGNIGTPPTSLQALSQDLYNRAINGVAGLGLSNPTAFAQELVSTVLGPNTPGSQTSIRELINERLNTLIQTNDANATEKIKENVRELLVPTLELYNLAERIRDPANTFLLCAQTGIMYSHNQPSNYLKSVDIAG